MKVSHVCEAGEMAQTKSTCYSDSGPDQAAHNRLQLQLWGIDLALVGIHTRVGIHFHTYK